MFSMPILLQGVVWTTFTVRPGHRWRKCSSTWVMFPPYYRDRFLGSLDSLTQVKVLLHHLWQGQKSSENCIWQPSSNALPFLLQLRRVYSSRRVSLVDELTSSLVDCRWFDFWKVDVLPFSVLLTFSSWILFCRTS